MRIPLIQPIAAMGGEVRAGHEALVLGPGHSTVNRSLSIKINDPGDDHDKPHRGAQAQIALISPVTAAASPAPTPLVIG
jgi:hypothetical protein